MKKTISIILFFFTISSACDCSAQTAYAYVMQIRLLKKSYKPLKKQIKNIKKEVNELIKEKQIENEKLKNQLTIAFKESMELAKINFSIKKNFQPFSTIKDFELIFKNFRK